MTMNKKLCLNSAKFKNEYLKNIVIYYNYCMLGTHIWLRTKRIFERMRGRTTVHIFFFFFNLT